MSDHQKTREELLQEVTLLRHEIERLQQLEAEAKQNGPPRSTRPVSDAAASVDNVQQVQVDMDRLLADISSKFLDLEIADLDAAILQALQQVGQFMGGDRVYQFLFHDNGLVMDNSHLWCAEGVLPCTVNLNNISSETFPYLLNQLRQFSLFFVPDIEQLPPSAQLEKTELKTQGVQSIICAPMFYQEEMLGFLGVDAVTNKKQWSGDDIRVLKLVAAIFVSTTVRLRTENALRISETRNIAILNAMPDLIFTLRSDYTVLDIRGGQMADLYKTRAQIIGKKVQEILPPNLSEQRIYYIDRALETGEPQYFEFEISIEGETHYEEGRIVVSGEHEVLNIVRDVTQRKIAENELAKRAAELETVARVSAAASRILNVPDLLQGVTDLTKEQFNLYHAHLYLLDETTNMLNLAAGAGEIGHKMVAHGWSIPLDRPKSLVARAARTRQGVIENDVRSAPDWLPNPLLPHTHSELAVPVMISDQVLGVLDVQSDQVNHFAPNDVRIQTTLAAQIAVALQNARLYAQTQKALKETEILYHGSDKIIRAHTMDEVLQALIQSTALQQLDRANILFFNRPWDDQMPEFMQVAAVWEKSGDSPVAPAGTEYKMAQLPIVKYLSRHEPTVFSDIPRDPRTDDSFYNLMVKQLGMSSIVAFPLIAGGHWIGFISGQSSRQLVILAEEIRQINNFTDQAAIVLQGQRLFEKAQADLASTERQAQRLADLNEIATSLSKAAEIEDVFKIVATNTSKIIDCIRSNVCFLTEGHTEFEIFALTGLEGAISTGDKLSLEGTSVGYSIKNTEIMIFGDAATSEYLDVQQMALNGINSIINVPMVVGGQVIGTINVGSQEKDAYRISDANLLQQIASLAASTIQNMRLLEQARARARREQLLREIAARVRGSNNPDIILRTAVRELGSVLNRSTFVQMKAGEKPPAQNGQAYGPHNEVNNG
jgi:PAS domain S-box-containing protein